MTSHSFQASPCMDSKMYLLQKMYLEYKLEKKIKKNNLALNQTVLIITEFRFTNVNRNL